MDGKHGTSWMNSSDSQTDGYGVGYDKLRGVSRQGYETGESSRTGSLVLNGYPSIENTRRVGQSSFRDGQLQQPQKPAAPARPRRKKRQTSNAFLLQDAVTAATDESHRQPARMASHAARGKAMRHMSDQPMPDHQKMRTPRPSTDNHSRSSQDKSSQQTSPDGPAQRALHPNAAQHQHSADVDAAQIVHMALSLNESRRIASTRRSASRTNPSASAPLPDPANGRSLKQHLQQQRKTSRGGSPMAGSPRIPYAAPRSGSPLQGSSLEAHNSGHDPYRWHFTPSTLSRAQKAREQLELRAEYMRLLALMPPITASNDVTSPPRTPANGVRAVDFRKKGSGASESRPYDPLQYIRNRKVRARERMVIDGERQGFNDVDAVRTWIDAIADHTSSSSTLASGASKVQQLPPFPGAVGQDENPGVVARAARSRRPRLDWMFDPCDLIADLYWLEQGYHKHLIEDRHWRKIVPGLPEPIRPRSRSTDGSLAATPFSTQTSDGGLDALHEHALSTTTPENAVSETLSQMRTREKARHKLHGLVPHRHHAEAHKGHDFLRLRRGSLADLSDSDDDQQHKAARHRPRTGTLSSDTNDLLQKQMLEILAKEAREKQLTELPETVAEHEDDPASSEAHDLSSRDHSRKGSVVTDRDQGRLYLNHSGTGLSSRPQHRSRLPSVDNTPKTRRQSTDDDSSVPVSPMGERPMVMTMGSANLSPPPSRSGSPTRARLLKSATHGPLHLDEVKERDEEGSLASPKQPTSPAQDEEKRDPSPIRRHNSVTSPDTAKGHRHANSKDVNTGIKSIFKGPSALRGGVSKLGDLLWKKDGTSEGPDVEPTDESDGEVARGRRRPTLSRHNSRRGEHKRQTSRHFLDAMPVFAHTAEAAKRAMGATDTHDAGVSPLAPARGLHSRQSSRFDLLKPPRLETGGHPTPSVSPPAAGHAEGAADEGGFAEKDKDHRAKAGLSVADRRLSSFMDLPPLSHHRSLSLAPSDTHSTQQTADSALIPRTKLSRAELARLRALILSSGIKALEITRRAESEHHPLGEGICVGHNLSQTPIRFSDIARLSPDAGELESGTFACRDLYDVAAKHLADSVTASTTRCHNSMHAFSSSTTPLLHRRLGTLRSRITDDLSSAARLAADLADETGKDLALSQPLKVRHAEDLIGRLARRRGRRFRWVRRAAWVAVEWTLVGFMWWVWLVVVVVRAVLGVGRGVVGGVRWLLWL